MGFTCPYCYDTHDIKDCQMRCSHVLKTGSCPDNVPFDGEMYINPRFYKKCLSCTRAKKDIYCPETIKKRKEMIIPMRCINSNGIPIALVGAKASGKSNYIGALLLDIKKRMTRSFDCSITMNCNAASKVQYDELYYNPLVKAKMEIGLTDRGDLLPMIFPIDFTSGKQVTLTFYDTAGENFDDEDKMLDHTGYLAHSKGIILLIDPLQVPEIREQLEGKIPLPIVNRDAIDILDRVIYNIESFTNNSRKPLDMPIALAFTKIDALDGFEDILPADSCLRYDSEHIDRGMFIKEDFENTQRAMEVLLENFIEMNSELNAKLKRFKRYALFGVSALGCIPDEAGNLGPEGLKSRRVLDPLLWLLAENKYIKIAKK